MGPVVQAYVCKIRCLGRKEVCEYQPQVGLICEGFSMKVVFGGIETEYSVGASPESKLAGIVGVWYSWTACNMMTGIIIEEQ